MTEVLNVVALVLALFLFLSSVVLIRPANGDRPLLVGFMFSSFFAIYIAIVRIYSLQALLQPIFVFVFLFWILTKLWALYATALHTRHPLLFSLRALGRFVFGHNPNVDK